MCQPTRSPRRGALLQGQAESQFLSWQGHSAMRWVPKAPTTSLSKVLGAQEQGCPYLDEIEALGCNSSKDTGSNWRQRNTLSCKYCGLLLPSPVPLTKPWLCAKQCRGGGGPTPEITSLAVTFKHHSSTCLPVLSPLPSVTALTALTALRLAEAPPTPAEPSSTHLLVVPVLGAPGTEGCPAVYGVPTRESCRSSAGGAWSSGCRLGT